MLTTKSGSIRYLPRCFQKISREGQRVLVALCPPAQTISLLGKSLAGCRAPLAAVKPGVCGGCVCSPFPIFDINSFFVLSFIFKRNVGRCGEIQENGIDRRDHAPLVKASVDVGVAGPTLQSRRHRVAAGFGKEDRRSLVQAQLPAFSFVVGALGAPDRLLRS